jgi:hypothetical protein
MTPRVRRLLPLGVLLLLDRLFRAELRGGDGATDGRAGLAGDRARGRWRAASSPGAGGSRPPSGDTRIRDLP